MDIKRGNKMSQGEGGGRPRKFKNVDDLQALIDAYFADCDENKIPYTITGLALSMGTWRIVLLDYEAGKYDEPGQKFSNTIKLAKAKVENYAEQKLFGGCAAAGPIFALKNFGWKDTTQVDIADISKKRLEELSDEELERIAQGEE